MGEMKMEDIITTVAKVLQPGEYEVVCGIPEHLEQGMQATLIVH